LYHHIAAERVVVCAKDARHAAATELALNCIFSTQRELQVVAKICRWRRHCALRVVRGRVIRFAASRLYRRNTAAMCGLGASSLAYVMPNVGHSSPSPA